MRVIQMKIKKIVEMYNEVIFLVCVCIHLLRGEARRDCTLKRIDCARGRTDGNMMPMLL